MDLNQVRLAPRIRRSRVGQVASSPLHAFLAALFYIVHQKNGSADIMTVQLQKMKMLVGGDWKDSSTGARSSVIDPSSGEIIAEVPRASKQDAKSAVDAARAAFESPEWRDMDSGKRGRILKKLAGLDREKSDQLARLEVENEENTLRESQRVGDWAAPASE